ncbi:MAG: hypothetical protein H6719_21365 [Sandaracinaceae bacterium]|nr:hypothetical protein [Sandaracinaceae bacterium]
MTQPSRIHLVLFVAAVIGTASPAAAWSDAGVDYCPISTLRPDTSEIPSDLPGLVGSYAFGGDTITIERVHEDGTLEPVETTTMIVSRGSETLIAVVGGWVEGARYRVSAMSACEEDERFYDVGAPITTPPSLGTVRSDPARWMDADRAVTDVWLDLSAEAAPFAGLWDVYFEIDGHEPRRLGVLSDPAQSSLNLDCDGRGGLWSEGPHEVRFQAGPPGADPIATSPLTTITLTCPASDPPPSTGGCSVGAPAPSGRLAGLAIAGLALVFARRRRPRTVGRRARG